MHAIRYIVLFIVLLNYFSSPAQELKRKEGLFMDTLMDRHSICDSPFLYFYSVGGKYLKSSTSLLNEVSAWMKNRHNIYSGSGYISFHFTIDCTGKMLHRVSVTETDEQYKETEFEKSLVNELFGFLKTLDQWKQAKDDAGKAYSYFGFMSFKIKNGQVINIIP